MRIKDEFCGYLQVDGDEYAYNVSKSIVTLLPAANNVNERFEYADGFIIPVLNRGSTLYASFSDCA